MKRRRKIKKLGRHGGKECGALTRYKECNKKQCGCSHVKCHLKDNKKFTGTGHGRGVAIEQGKEHLRRSIFSIQVTHDKLEQKGNKHVCGYDSDTGTCECRCRNEDPMAFAQRAI